MSIIKNTFWLSNWFTPKFRRWGRISLLSAVATIPFFAIPNQIVIIVTAFILFFILGTFNALAFTDNYNKKHLHIVQ